MCTCRRDWGECCSYCIGSDPDVINYIGSEAQLEDLRMGAKILGIDPGMVSV